jgi:hypothetical protein
MAYALGAFLCVLWPLALQVILTRAIPRSTASSGELAMELGYSFTGLTALGALFVLRRTSKVLLALGAEEPDRQSRTVLREILIYSALFELSAVYGLIYYAMGGPNAERYGRSFIAVPTVMFFLFVPRWTRWRAAAEKR